MGCGGSIYEFYIKAKSLETNLSRFYNIKTKLEKKVEGAKDPANQTESLKNKVEKDVQELSGISENISREVKELRTILENQKKATPQKTFNQKTKKTIT